MIDPAQVDGLQGGGAVVLWLAVAAAGAAGAVARHVIDHVVQHRVSRHRPGGSFPTGTLVVNVTGSLLFAAILGAATVGRVTDEFVVVAAIGFCGAYTTFSTHMMETIGLLDRHTTVAAGLCLVANCLLGIAAAAAGLHLGRLLG